jgi:hypothetical protein
VLELAPGGGGVAYATLLGGGNIDYARDVALDGSGHAYVTGGTTSTDLPVTPGAFQAKNKITTGYSTSFVTKLALPARPSGVPTVTSLSRSTAVEGDAALTLTVNGSNFGSAPIVLWDGTALTTTVVSPTQLQAFVPASAVAEEETATVGIHDAAGTSGTSSYKLFLVNDAPLGNAAISDLHPTHGVPLGSSPVTIATFTDANPSPDADDFTAFILWGDGASQTVTSAGGGIVRISGQPNPWAVLANHTYASKGTYWLSVNIYDAGGASVSVSQPITVS